MTKKFEAPAVGWGGEPRIFGDTDSRLRIMDTFERIQHNEKVRAEYCRRKGIDLSKLNYAEKLAVMDKALEWNKDMGEALE